MKVAELVLAGDKLQIILEAGFDLVTETKLEPKKIVARMIAEEEAHNAAQMTVYEAVNHCCYCIKCEAWHVNKESLNNVVNYLIALHKEMYFNLNTLVTNTEFQPKIVVEWLELIAECIGTLNWYLLSENSNANSSKVLH